MEDQKKGNEGRRLEQTAEQKEIAMEDQMKGNEGR